MEPSERDLLARNKGSIAELLPKVDASQSHHAPPLKLDRDDRPTEDHAPGADKVAVHYDPIATNALNDRTPEGAKAPHKQSHDHHEPEALAPPSGGLRPVKRRSTLQPGQPVGEIKRKGTVQDEKKKVPPWKVEPG